MAQGRARLWTIPPGVAFLDSLAARLLDGSLTDQFRHDPENPLALADVKIFLPTRRAVRELRASFAEKLGGEAAILPEIRALGEVDEDEGFLGESLPEAAEALPPIEPVPRLLELAGLILPWRNRLSDELAGLHGGSPLVAPASPADAVWLARDLAELIDAMETEGVDWDRLSALEQDNYAVWWQLTAEFLGIAAIYWPGRLDELGRSSAVAHRNGLLAGEAERLRTLSSPVIIAGSAGSVPAVAGLIAAAAEMENGVIVLPGLDTAMPEADFQALTAPDLNPAMPDPSIRSHPQYEMARLIERLGLTRAEFEALETPEPDSAARHSVLAAAFAPAEATDRWEAWRETIAPDDLARGFAEVALVEAANERQEAVAVAIALRLALEQETEDGRPSRAALITPDRDLARRVAAELGRFQIEADDSAGTPLAATGQGTLLTLMLEAALKPGDPATLAALLKHPLARFGLSARAMRGAAAAFELLALRGGTRLVPLGHLEAFLDDALEKQTDDRHPPRWRSALPKTAADDARDLARRIDFALQSLIETHVARGPDRAPITENLMLADWAARTGRALEATARDATDDLAALWSGEAGERLAAMLSEIMGSSTPIEADGPQWIEIVAALSASEAVKPRQMGNPRVFIFGAVEARLQDMDTIVLGGMNEGVWPTQPKNNPFLSRGMKAEIGLEPPEKRVGQLAHDLWMTAGAPRLVISRALRQGTAPTVASRWLQRLLAFGGPGLAADLGRRGAVYRDWAEQLDAAPRQPIPGRPAPYPPAERQPERYSFSEIGRLRRDPYAVYAQKVLKLDPLLPLNADPGVKERGILYHALAERFIKSGARPDSEEGRAAMDEIIAELLFEAELAPHLAVSWVPRLRSVADEFLAFETRRRALVPIEQSLTEVPAGFDIPLAGVRLTGIADRIDMLAGGGAEIIDYKTGSSPSLKQARTLLDPQLPLEAAALAVGGFKEVAPVEATSLKYVRLRPGHRFIGEALEKAETAKEAAITAEELAADALREFTRFVIALKSGERPFASRLVPASARDFSGEYDHLARVAEWSTADDGEGGDDD
ncbi:double-strand break repair protein AddB [Martelella mediterranea]|uniref:Double-strand break repair protein AddB n=1 Tax=Martelella mediterranea DSM 17316 TaxID=1122214 RepID=A0A1U9YX83_9HYPH|nr:double-strand break repair protein AddB [Martelella mediterranea]AQZ49972.1 double-strand break repair protein AddB [Martelella mediterranea DSM 17316]